MDQGLDNVVVLEDSRAVVDDAVEVGDLRGWCVPNGERNLQLLERPLKHLVG